MGEFQPPPGAMDVSIPRTTSHIAAQTIILSLLADYAYTSFFELLPRSVHTTVLERALLTFVFWHMPELLLVQLGSIFFGTGIEKLNCKWPDFLSEYAGLVGLRSFKRRDYMRSMEQSSLFKLAVLAPALFGLWIGFMAYIERFGIKYHQATDVGNLGIDHRNGWVSGGGLMAGVFAAIYRLYLWHSATMQGDFVAPEAEQLSTSKNGIEGMTVLDTEAGNRPTCNLQSSRTVLLVEAFVASIIHQILLSVTHRGNLVANLLLPVLVVIFVLGAVTCKKSQPGISRKAGLLLKGLMAALVVWTILGASLHDLNELYDASDGVVQQWSFRWPVTDRFDRLMRYIL